MGNRVTFDIGGNVDSSVTNAAKKFQEVLKATAELFPSMNSQAKIAGDTIRVTLTEAKAAAERAGGGVQSLAASMRELTRLAKEAQRENQAAFDSRFISIDQLRGDALTFAREQDAIAAKKASTATELYSKSLRSSNLLMFEASRAAQDFAQVIGQQGVSGAVRASANNLQRMVEILSFTVPGIKTMHLVGASLITAMLVPLSDWLFKSGKKANEAKKEVADLTKVLKELRDESLRLQTGGIEKLEDAALQGKVKEAQAAAITARLALAEEQKAAEQRAAFAGLNLGLSKKELRELAAKGKTIGEVALERDPKLIAARVAEMEARRNLAAIEKQAAEIQERRDKKRQQDAKDDQRRRLQEAAEIPGRLRDEIIRERQAGLQPEAQDIGFAEADLGIRQNRFEAGLGGRGPRTARDRAAAAAFKKERDVLQERKAKHDEAMLREAKAGTEAAQSSMLLLQQAVMYSLRLPIVPLPNVNVH